MLEVTLYSNSKGQIVLPKAPREALGLSEGDRMTVTLEDDHITIRPVHVAPLHDWRSWRGRLTGTGALQEHLSEHADEVKRERPP